MMKALDLLEAAADFTDRRGADRSQNRPFQLGKIDPAYVASTFPGTLPAVIRDGESTAGKPLAVLSSYVPAPGDRVLLIPAGSTYIIAGKVIGG